MTFITVNGYDFCPSYCEQRDSAGYFDMNMSKSRDKLDFGGVIA